ncbi:MFS transporter [Kineococcus glutinatus]|uniref:MFS transporter n=1 Tax=Kineococcus glutinatus TaxID=1070872 RepID=A0ABP9HYU0_9ACTN
MSSSPGSVTETTAARSSLPRVVAASLVGTVVEWYDFFLYGTAAALVFPRVFFPESDPLIGTLLSFATYALGFVARPLGGLVFGHYGDRLGRKKLLMFSLVLMGVATFAIGLLPTYGQVGIAAPLLLVFLRLVQGFAVGGEWGGAVLLVAEYGTPRRRAFWASWPQAGVPAGNLVAAAVLAVLSATLSDDAFFSWGWRVAFLLSGVLVVLGWWIRQSVEDSPVFREARQRTAERGAPPKLPAAEVVRTFPRGLLTGAGLRFGENIAFYVITAFSLTYVVETGGLSRTTALNAVLVGAAVEVCAIPLFGVLADRVGRRVVTAVGAAGMVAWAFAFFPLLDTGSTGLVIVAVVVGLVLHGAMYGPQAAFIAECFPTRLRYTGSSIAYQLTSIVAGSLAPIIAVALLDRTDSSLPISVYVAASCVVTVVAALTAHDRTGVPFEEIDARFAAEAEARELARAGARR